MKYKNKHLQSLATVAMLCIFALCFTNCSKDDNEPVPDEIKADKRMKSIDDLTFVYSDGKIVQEKTPYISSVYLTYTESSIKRGKDVYHLDNGLVSKYTAAYNKYHKYQLFTYENGRIKTWKKYDENWILAEDIVFEWKDDVIVRQTQYNKNDEGMMELFCDYQYRYTSDIDYGGAIACLQYDSLFYDDLPESLIIQGYFGKWPKYLVYSAIDASGNFELNRVFGYYLDNDNYPLSMKEVNVDKITFTWENIN